MNSCWNFQLYTAVQFKSVMGVHPGSEGGPRPPGPMRGMMSGPYTGK